jgi:hypothetical protein
VVEPVHPLQGGQFHGFPVIPESPELTQLGFVQPVDGFGQHVVVGGLCCLPMVCARLTWPLGAADAHLLRAPVGMVDQIIGRRLAFEQNLLPCIQNKVSLHSATVAQLRIWRANTSMTKAKYSQLFHVFTDEGPDTHRRLGMSALQTRLTRSSGHGAEASGIVARADIPLRTPCEPALRLILSKLQHLTLRTARLLCSQTLLAPWTCQLV